MLESRSKAQKTRTRNTLA